MFFYLHCLSGITNSHNKKVSRGERTKHLSTENRDPATCTEICDLGACLKKNSDSELLFRVGAKW